ncbi:hypothetical protein HYY75_02930 [bacterium]|nr:hypothetical protein [bacterium]
MKDNFLRAPNSLNKLPLVFLLLFLNFPALVAVELDDVFRLASPYRVAQMEKLRVYYPASCERVMPRIISSFGSARNRLQSVFPELQGIEISIILTDFDDRDNASVDSTFDLVTLSIFEEANSLSARGYSIEERFSIKVANLMILKSLGSPKMAWRRRLGLLSIPPWFIEGLSLHYAFPMNALHTSRLFERVRRGKLFTLLELDTFIDREGLIREDMRSQARSMIDYWIERGGKDSGKRFLREISSRPIIFSNVFKKVFGFSMQDGIKDYEAQMRNICVQTHENGPIIPEVLKNHGAGRFFQSLRKLPWGGEAWVSSARYREEVYDLWVRDAKGKIILALKNVHPAFWVDPVSETIFIGRYVVTPLRQRRLVLWSVSKELRKKQLISCTSSFKPLGMWKSRLFYVQNLSGQTSIMSIDPSKEKVGREEFSFESSIHPLDLTIDPALGKIFFVVQESGNTFLLETLQNNKSYHHVLFSCPGMIRRIESQGTDLWFLSETSSHTLQLFKRENQCVPIIEQYSQFPGGVWDYEVHPTEILATTIRGQGFWPISFARAPIQIKDDIGSMPVLFEHFEPSITYATTPYRLEYRSSYWLPKLNRDDHGGVLGITSYKADRLDRGHIVVTPTFGFKSKNWGYSADIMQRYDFLKTGLSFQDQVVRKSYLSNSYYERIRSTDLHFNYPFSLSTSLTVGGNLTNRGVAKFPENGGIYPSVGRDHSLYFGVLHKAIRSEPLIDVFPQKGRIAWAGFRRGLKLFNGQFFYNSVSSRWDEFIPLGGKWVATVRAWVAEDDKKSGIRRPDDLSLGGRDFLRGYPASFRFGDSLRAGAIHLGRPIGLPMLILRPWLQKEILVGEVFFEKGDVRTSGQRFHFLSDFGLELRAKLLLFRRVPITLRWGAAWPSNHGKKQNYWTVDFSSLTSAIQ